MIFTSNVVVPVVVSRPAACASAICGMTEETTAKTRIQRMQPSL